MLVTGHRSNSQDIRLAARHELSNWALIRRMLTLGWAYRWTCLRVLFLQLVAQVLALLGLGLIGFGIDIIQFGATGDGPNTWTTNCKKSTLRQVQPWARA